MTIGKLVADDELRAFTFDLARIVQESVFESAKKFHSRPDQIVLEIDSRVKVEVARMMGKEQFKLNNFIVALNKIAKEELQDIAGDEHTDFHEMTEQIDAKVRQFIRDLTGKEDSDGKDIEDALEKEMQHKVMAFVSSEHFSMDTVVSEIDKKRMEILKARVGEDDAEHLQWLANMATKTYTGMQTYTFGSLTTKMVSDVFGNEDSKKRR